MKDLHNNIDPLVALDVAEIGSSTTTVGNIIDLQDYQSVEFLIVSGTLVDGTYVVLLEDGDDSALGDAAAVADKFLLGTEADAGFALTEDDTVKKLGYVGSKRYVRLSIISTVVTSGGDFGALAVLGAARHAPV